MSNNIFGHNCHFVQNSLIAIFKGVFFYETRQKIFSLPWREIVFEFWPLRQFWAVGPIQI